MKGYFWRESRAKIVAIVKTKIQLVQNTLQIAEYESLPKFDLKFKLLENLRKPLTLRSTRKRIDIDLERISNVCALARLTKIENVCFSSGGFSYAIQEKLAAWRVNSTQNFTWKTDIARITQVKFNVEFTRQAVIFSIKLASQLLQSSKGAFAGNARGKNHDPLLDSSVIACDKIKQRKVFSENVGIWTGKASNIWEGK